MTQVFDLTSNVPKQEESPSSSFSAEGVQANPTWTQITIVRTRNNSAAAGYQDFISRNVQIVPETKREVITTGPSSVPVEGEASRIELSSTTRISSSIALPLPKNLSYSSANDWSSEEAGFLDRIVGQAGSGQIESFSDGIQNAADYMRNRIINTASQMVTRSYVKKTGAHGNPYKEVFYGGVSFRTFQFSWELAPKSEKEAQTIERLLYQLELSSHPEFIGETDFSAYWIPDSFEIEFKGTALPKMQRLVLTSMEADYSPYGPKFIADGWPAFIGLSLSFMEVDIRTKKEIREAYEGRNVSEAFS